jgi:hypothetical protein
VYRGRWGWYPCLFELFAQLKELNKRLTEARRRKAAHDRWSRKLPHNRRGPEPALPDAFCQRLTLPSGRTELVLVHAEVETAYRTARHPTASEEEVQPLPIEERTIRELFAKYMES